MTISPRVDARIPPAISPAIGRPRELFDGTLVHSFEDWFGEYGGDTNAWNVGTEADGYQCVTHEDRGAGATTGDLGGANEVSSTSGLNAYPGEGDAYRVDYRPVGDLDDHTWIGTYTQSETSGADGYWLKIYHDGWVELVARTGGVSIGSGTTLDSGDALADDSAADYTAEITVDAGSLTGRILAPNGDEMLVLSGSDSNLGPLGVGFGANTDASAVRESYVDFARFV